MKRAYIIILFFISLLGTAAGQGKATLDKSAQIFEKSGGVKASFSLQRTEKGSNSSYTINGTIKNKGKKLMMKTPESTIWYDGTTQWVFSPDHQEVNISTPDENDTSMFNPAVLLRLYQNGFVVKSKGVKKVGNTQCEEIELTQENKKLDWQKITIFVAKESLLPLKIEITDKSEGKSQIILSNIDTKTNLTDNEFVFNKKDYPNVEIVDLR